MSNNSKQQNLHFNLLVKNVGPLNDLEFHHNDEAKDKKIAYCIYANNGSGKTFISRCFSLCNLEKKELNLLSKNLITVDETKWETFKVLGGKKLIIRNI